MSQNTLGSRIAALRKKIGMKQEDLARELHIQRVKVTQIETDKRQPNLDELSAIAAIFNVSTDYLLCRTTVPKPDADMRAVCDITGLDLDSVMKLQMLLPALKGLDDNGKPTGNIIRTFGATINAIIQSNAFSEIVSTLYKISDIDESDGFEYDEIGGRVTKAQLNPIDDLYRVTGGTLFSLRDIYAMRYEKATKKMFDEVVSVLDDLPKPYKPAGFTFHADGRKDPLQPPPKMKYRKVGDPLPEPPTATQEELEAAQNALDELNREGD